uniref:Uncharacterized protein n=1 Tax=Anguilla anguilla TaxID=7936 RepID=A0A0E9VJN4_ANGAN
MGQIFTLYNPAVSKASSTRPPTTPPIISFVKSASEYTSTRVPT